MNFLKRLFKKKKPANDKEQKQKRISYREFQEIKQKRKQGLNRYFFDDKYLWALNEKNATSKALKRGWIKK